MTTKKTKTAKVAETVKDTSTDSSPLVVNVETVEFSTEVKIAGHEDEGNYKLCACINKADSTLRLSETKWCADIEFDIGHLEPLHALLGRAISFVKTGNVQGN